MKQIFIFIVLVSISLIKSYGQKYDYYGMSIRSVYLPMGLVKGESYFSDSNNKVIHIEFFNKSTQDSIIRNRLGHNNFSTKYIEIVDSLINQNEFQITVDEENMNSIFSIINKSKLKSFDRNEFNEYFSSDRAITLLIDNFEIDTSLSVHVFLDEPWFTLNIKYCRENSKDTVDNDVIFVGSDYLKTENIKNWLIGFIVLNRMNIFNKITTIKDDVSEQKLNEVIARYIITQEMKK